VSEYEEEPMFMMLKEMAFLSLPVTKSVNIKLKYSVKAFRQENIAEDRYEAAKKRE
jgi:hypothetical protein